MLAVINEFAFNGEPRGREYAEQLIQDTHVAWKKLLNLEDAEPSRSGTPVPSPSGGGLSIKSAGLTRSTSHARLAQFAGPQAGNGAS